MWKLLVTRVLQAIFTLWVVSVGVFFSARITGSPDLALMPPDAMPPDRVRFRAVSGLDRQLTVQYGRWLTRVLHGDLGQGIQHKVSVLELIGPRLVNSLRLATVAVSMALALSLPLGVLAGVKRGQLWDRIAM